MPRLLILWVAMVLLSAGQAVASCSQTEDGGTVLRKKSAAGSLPILLETGKQVTALRDTDDAVCSISFVIGEETKITFELSSMPPPGGTDKLPLIPFDIAEVGGPDSSGSSQVHGTDAEERSTEGTLTSVILRPGRYVLTFPSRNEKIRDRWMPNRQFQPNAVRMTVAAISRAAPANHLIKLAPGEEFDINYGAFGKADPVSVQAGTDSFVVVSISSDNHLSNPAIIDFLRINVEQATARYPTGHWMFPQRTSHFQNKDESQFGFYLPAGKSILQSYIGRPQLHYVTPRELWATKFIVRFEEVRPNDPPPVLVARVNQMLEAGGYRKYIEAIDIASIHEVQADALHHEIRVADFLDFKGRVSSRSEPEVIFFNRYSIRRACSVCVPPTIPTGKPDFAVPTYLILMELHQDGFEFLETQRQIIQKNEQSLFDLILTQVSLGLGVSRRDIGIVVPARCTLGLVRGDTMIDTSLRNAGCAGAAAAFRELRSDDFTRSGAAKAETLSKNMNEFPVTVETFLNAKFDAKNIQYLSREPDYVEVIVRGLKGYVIKGSPYWEKLVIFFIKQPEQSGDYRIRLIADGYLAAGAGAYPPDSQFDTNIEERNSKSLTDFVSSLLDGFAEAATGGGQRHD